MNDTSRNDTIDFLSGIPFFAEVSSASLANLYDSFKSIPFFKGEEIFNKGDEGTSMFVLLNGKVKVHDGDHVYGFLSRGDCFGEYSMIDGQTRSASVTAAEKVEVLQLQYEDFLQLMAEDDGFAKGILKVMIKRHRELDTIQEQLATSRMQLEQSLSQIDNLVKGAMDSIILFNTSFRIMVTNPAAHKLLENENPEGRNMLFFFDDNSADLIESIVKDVLSGTKDRIDTYLPQVVKVVGSDGTETLNEGTISVSGEGGETLFILILRNIEDRLVAKKTIDALTEKTAYLEEEIEELTDYHGIITADAAMRQVLTLVKQVAKTDATVLVTGETGTGKELIARAIHKASDRAAMPLIRINCGAIPANLIESELFGHEKGAFTGATADRKGRFLLADKGTIFLDEIGELPLDLQPKLLRVIQEGEFDPVGSSKTVKVDVRIIAATHRDLKKLAADHKFREDLYYRLNVFPVEIPALRERKDDIIPIAKEMIRHFSRKLNKTVVTLSKADITALMSYNWPGNVRELQNIIERGLILSKDGKTDWKRILPGSTGNDMAGNSKDHVSVETPVMTVQALNELEKQNILKALKQTKWRISGKQGAAALLNTPPTTLASRMKALGIERPV